MRIYPRLTLVLLLSVFLIGPIFTTLGTLEYFRSTAIYSYLGNNLMLFSMKFQLPGVFEDTPWPGINGSLWTLFYEVTLYVLVGGLGALRSMKSETGSPVFCWCTPSSTSPSKSCSPTLKC